MLDIQATIAAIATAPGVGGIAVLRVSGENALTIAGSVFSRPIQKLRSHTAYFGKFLNHKGEFLDEGLLLIMRAPKSYTGEDVVELHCHGGSLIAQHLLNALLLAGAKMATPGEFTRRAFLHGKLDLAQAEAVQSLISAKNTLALKASSHLLEGRLSEEIQSLQTTLIDVSATLEAWVDFPEEDLEPLALQDILFSLNHVLQKIKALETTFEKGKLLDKGFSLCLTGRPNVGKSSLLNALTKKERAIVTPIAGTTRDLIHEELSMGSLHVRLTDTAGLRETSEVIEKEGIVRTYRAAQEADLILFVVDGPIEEEDLVILSGLPQEKILILFNKCDLYEAPVQNIPYDYAIVSAKEYVGLEELKEKIEQKLWQGGLPDKSEIILTQSRHHEALVEAMHSIEKVLLGFEQAVSPEFLSFDLKTALKALGRVIGMDVTEEILHAIFAKFCLGK